MPRKCTICTHAERKGIDKAIQNNVEYGVLASKYNVSVRALGGHFKNHLKPVISKANAAAEKALVRKIVEFRREVNYSALEKGKFAQDRILAELDNAVNVSDRIAVLREFRGWYQEENKLAGNYTDNKENPANLSDTQKAQAFYSDLIRLGMNAATALEVTKSEYDLPGFKPKDEFVN